MNWKSGMSTVAVVLILAGCKDAPTSPSLTSAVKPATKATISTDPNFDPTLVTYNSANCSIVDVSTADVACEYDLTNPGVQTLNGFLQAQVTYTWGCLSTKTGRVGSTKTVTGFITDRAARIDVGSNVQTDLHLTQTPYIRNDYTGKEKKLNACKGNDVPTITASSIEYWSLVVDDSPDENFHADTHWSCIASDDSYGCYTN